MNRRQLLVALLAFTIAGVAHAAPADGYPSKPVKIVVPYPPGGSADIIGRMVGDKLSKSLGQPVVVENKGGASGAIGSEFVAHADPDGYTLLIAIADTHAINPAIAVGTTRGQALAQPCAWRRVVATTRAWRLSGTGGGSEAGYFHVAFQLHPNIPGTRCPISAASWRSNHFLGLSAHSGGALGKPVESR